MKFTNIKKKNRPISKRIGAITMAALIGFTPASLFNFSVAAGSEKQEECEPTILNGSLVGIESLFYKMYDEMTTPIEVSTMTTSSTSTTASTTATTTTTTESTTTTEMTTTTTTEATTTTETEKTTEAETTTEVATTVEEPVVEEPTQPVREYVVYKPSTHYIHRSTCRWFNSECYEIEDTEGLECRRCSECNPEMEIVTEYAVPTPQQPTQPAVTNNGGYYSLNFITDVERIYLCNVVGSEYGSDGVSLYDRACVVATVMNRVHDGGWTNGKPNSIYNVLTAPYQYNPDYAVPYYRYNVTQSVIDSVEYYFQHQGEFPHYTSYCGDGRRNYFR